jgi:hypothetical protein
MLTPNRQITTFIHLLSSKIFLHRLLSYVATQTQTCLKRFYLKNVSLNARVISNKKHLHLLLSLN